MMLGLELLEKPSLQSQGVGDIAFSVGVCARFQYNPKNHTLL